MQYQMIKWSAPEFTLNSFDSAILLTLKIEKSSDLPPNDIYMFIRYTESIFFLSFSVSLTLVAYKSLL